MTDRSELEALADELWNSGIGGNRAENERRAFAMRIGELARRLQPARVPEGFVLVPSEPNRAMQDAGMDAARVWFGDEIARSGITRSSAIGFFKAMLATAPAAEGDVIAHDSGVDDERSMRHAFDKFTSPAPESREAGLRDAYEGARSDLLDWKSRAQRAEAELRRLGYAGIDASEKPEAGQREGVESEIASLIQDATGCADSDSVYAAMAVMNRLASAQQAGTGSRGEGEG